MKVYVIVYAIVVGFAALWIATPVIPTSVLLLTFGYALPLLVTPTAALYMTALWPAIIAHRRGRSWGSTLALGSLCIGGVAVVPGLVARAVAVRDAAPALRQDFAARLDGSPPRLLEIEITSPILCWHERSLARGALRGGVPDLAAQTPS